MRLEQQFAATAITLQKTMKYAQGSRASCNYKDNRAVPAWKCQAGSNRIERGQNRDESDRKRVSDGRKAKIVSLPHIWGDRRRKRGWWEFLDFKKDEKKRLTWIETLREGLEKYFDFFDFSLRSFQYDEYTFSRLQFNVDASRIRVNFKKKIPWLR